MEARKTIRPSEACKILCISRGTFNKWVNLGVILIANRFPASPNRPLGERRFYLDDILALEKEIRSSLK